MCFFHFIRSLSLSPVCVTAVLTPFVLWLAVGSDPWRLTTAIVWLVLVVFSSGFVDELGEALRFSLVHKTFGVVIHALASLAVSVVLCLVAAKLYQQAASLSVTDYCFIFSCVCLAVGVLWQSLADPSTQRGEWAAFSSGVFGAFACIFVALPVISPDTLCGVLHKNELHVRSVSQAACACASLRVSSMVCCGRVRRKHERSTQLHRVCAEMGGVLCRALPCAADSVCPASARLEIQSGCCSSVACLAHHSPKPHAAGHVRQGHDVWPSTDTQSPTATVAVRRCSLCLLCSDLSSKRQPAV